MKGLLGSLKKKPAAASPARSLADRLAELPDLGPGRLAVWVEDPAPAEPNPAPSRKTAQ